MMNRNRVIRVQDCETFEEAHAMAARLAGTVRDFGSASGGRATRWRVEWYENASEPILRLVEYEAELALRITHNAAEKLYERFREAEALGYDFQEEEAIAYDYNDASELMRDLHNDAYKRWEQALQLPVEHERDSDCILGSDHTCIECGVWHGDKCPDCGGRGFHDSDCERREDACPECKYLPPRHAPGCSENEDADEDGIHRDSITRAAERIGDIDPPGTNR